MARNWLAFLPVELTGQCVIVIPCYNEAAGLAALLPELHQYSIPVIIVDDGSTDFTPKLAEQHGASLIRLNNNQGKGTALRAGWKRAEEMGFTWALTMDGDGQHSPQDISHFLSLAAQGNHDLIIGNRMADTDTMPCVRRWTNQWMSWMLSRTLKQSLPDTQCGFRLLRLALLKDLDLTTSRFEIESEVLAQVALTGHQTGFVPIQTIYKEEQSKIQPVRDALRWFRWLASVKRRASHSATMAKPFTASEVSPPA